MNIKLGQVLRVVALEKAYKMQILEMNLSNLESDKSGLVDGYKLGVSKKTDQYLSELVDEYNDFGSPLSYRFLKIGLAQGLDIPVELSEFTLVAYRSGISYGGGPLVFFKDFKTKLDLELSILKQLRYGLVAEDLIAMENGEVRDFILEHNKKNLKIEVRWLI